MNKKFFLLLSGVAVFVLATPVLAENLDDKLTPKENQQSLEFLSVNSSDSPIIYTTNSEIFQQDFTLAQTNEETQMSPSSSMERVTSVSQLSDVQPSDWAFAALQSLVERYGVISGYPDGSFKGNRTLTRYEFAAGLNAALDKINELIAAGLTDKVRKEDLVILQNLREEFAGELGTIKSRIDTLEARNANIEAQQFSTTVILGGQVIFGLATGFGGDPPGKGEANTIISHLTQLQLVSSFTGKDRFRVALVTGNSADDSFSNPDAFNTNMARLSWQADYDNQVRVDSVEYRVAGLSDRVVFTFKPVGFSLSSVLSVNSPYADAGQGAISLFAGSTPIFKIGSLDAGLGFDWLLSDELRLQFAYGTRNSSDSSRGIFGADHSALGVQLLYKPTPSLITGLAYVNAYSSNGQLDTGTGSSNADTSGGINEPSQIHGINASMKWQLSDRVVFGAWGGLMVTNSLQSDAVVLSSTYTVSLGLYDPFGRKGDLLGLLVGQPPKLNNGILVADVDSGNSTHYEVFYRYLVNDNIAITPGFFIVTDPGHISRNDDIFIGAIRTTFSF
ncbi:iron uptake porin [Dendronalium sp. ChiSLP03b]|uniref:iron uptake porin n=1 Tax=Dendronalium sp. ChiSLP03b TaxID=3075381 RepID=UPI002AD260A1|nr:iron uptake porin [Dendronalium sp. ChiSLP03b]MDZ8206253.1 iron uptake porin [Dendronalium sp. ChiSLP03b]